MKAEIDEVFSRFSRPVRRAILEKGFSEPTETQIRAIPKILDGRNVLLMAPTGTGKTEAAILPILDSIFTTKGSVSGIKALYITPLRALNRDMMDRLEWWCKRLDIRLAVRHGDTDVKERAKHSLVPPKVLITTPETLQAILPGSIMRRHLMSVRWVIVDEVHELAGEKRGSQLSIALERLRYLTEKDFQVIGLSATIGTPEEVAKFLVGVGRPCDVVKVPVARSTQIQVVYPVPDKEDHELASAIHTYPEVAARLRLIRELVKQSTSSLVFTNTRTESEALASRFRVWDSEFPIGVHHGSLSKPSRVRAETLLKEGKLRGIICTSSLELGIDIGDLDMVIQYNSPRQVTRLLQRVGRSGHKVGGVAKGVIITQDSDDALESLVITRRALVEDLEPVKIPRKPFDTLTHQLVGLLLHKNRWYFEDALEIITNSYPYVSLRKEELVRVLQYMHERYPRLAWVSQDNKIFAKPRNIKEFYSYYFENLSMIPDQKQYLVLQEDGSPVGVLDEAFVAEHGEIGVKFIEGGTVWKIIQVYGDKIYVSPQEDPSGALPSWIGDEIPVPFNIAMEVGAIRREVEDAHKAGGDHEETVRMLTDRYHCSHEVMWKAVSEVVEQIDKGYHVPTDRVITVEKCQEFIVINCCFGHLVNRTLGRILGHMISLKTGQSVGVHQDPYRIILHHSSIGADQVYSILTNASSQDIRGMAVEAFTKTGMFKRRLIHVAKKSGVLAKEADLSGISLESLIEGLKDSVVYEEAVKTILEMDSDVDGTINILRKIDRDEIQIKILEITDEFSPVARVGIEEVSRKSDVVPPERMTKIILESTRARLLNEGRTAICTSCWGYYELLSLRDIVHGIKCTECGLEKIAFLDKSEDDVRMLAPKIRASKVDPPKKLRRLVSRALKLGELYAKYGFPAAVVSAGRGLRVSEIEEILNNEEKYSERLVELIIQAEKKALKRRYFAS